VPDAIRICILVRSETEQLTPPDPAIQQAIKISSARVNSRFQTRCHERVLASNMVLLFEGALAFLDDAEQFFRSFGALVHQFPLLSPTGLGSLAGGFDSLFGCEAAAAGLATFAPNSGEILFYALGHEARLSWGLRIMLTRFVDHLECLGERSRKAGGLLSPGVTTMGAKKSPHCVRSATMFGSGPEEAL